MFCTNCGSELSEGDKFCANCGEKLEEETAQKQTNDKEVKPEKEEKQENTQKSEPSPTPAANNQQPKTQNENKYKTQMSAEQAEFLAKRKKKIKRIAIVGGIALVVIIAAIIITVTILDANKVKNDFINSDIVKNGPVSSKFVKPSDYKVNEFNITNTADQGSQKIYTYTAKIENDNFKADIEGKATYSNNKIDNYDNYKKEVTPKKGVDYFEESLEQVQRKEEGSEKTNGTQKVSNASSTLNDDDGTYVSDLTASSVYSFWYCEDTCNIKQHFKFDSKNGWTKNGGVDKTDGKTEWKLANKTITYDNKNEEWNNLTITFNSITNNICSFTYNFHLGEKSAKSYTDANSLDYTATVSVPITHKVGEEGFSCNYYEASVPINVYIEANNYAKNRQSDKECNVDFRVKAPKSPVFYLNDNYNLKKTNMTFKLNEN